jgi:hypothetical protein
VSTGLGLGIRHGELVHHAWTLSCAGFTSRASLTGLTLELAWELGVPAHFAVALQSKAQLARSWKKFGPLPPVQKIDPDELETPDDVAKLAHVSAGFPTFEANPVKMQWMNLRGGFPSPLRHFEPIRKEGTPCSRARHDRSVRRHVVRQRTGEEERHKERCEMRISGVRRDAVRDSWLKSSFQKPCC